MMHGTTNIKNLVGCLHRCTVKCYLKAESNRGRSQ